MFTFSQFVDALIKGHGHRYIKRIPYMTPKGRRYRYIYKVTHSHKGKQAIHEDHLDVGTKFMLHTESGKEVHGHIKSVDGDKVTYVIDDGADKGKEVTGTKAEILAMLNEKHGVEEQLQEKRDQLKADIEQAKQTGTEKQVARLEAQLKKLGGETTKEESSNNVFNKKHEHAIDKIASEVEEYQQQKSYSNKSKMEKLGTQRAISDYLKNEFLIDSGLTKTDQNSFSFMFNSFSILGKIADIIETHPQIEDLDAKNMSAQIKSIVTDLTKRILNLLSMEADDRQSLPTRILLKKYASPENAKELVNHFDDALKITGFRGRRLRIQNDNLAIMDIQGKDGEIGSITFSNSGVDTQSMPKLTKEQENPFKSALDIMNPIISSFSMRSRDDTAKQAKEG